MVFLSLGKRRVFLPMIGRSGHHLSSTLLVELDDFLDTYFEDIR